jgi:hypothetical protein
LGFEFGFARAALFGEVVGWFASSERFADRFSRGLECLVLIGRDGVVGEDVLEFLGASTVRGQPGVEVLGSQIDDAAIVAGGSDVAGWFVDDAGKSAQVRFVRVGPERPQAISMVCGGLGN